MSVNTAFVWLMVITFDIGGLNAGYVVAYQNQLTPCFEAKFNWSGYEAEVNNAVLGASAILGLTIGALGGGLLMRKGRRLSMIICLCVGIIGNLISGNIYNFKMLLAGRLIYGIVCGAYSCIVPKYFYESMPIHLKS